MPSQITSGATLTDSASLRAALSDESGSGAALFDSATNPTLIGATITGQLLNSFNSAASISAKYMTGAWFTGGTGTTTFPHLLLQATGTTASTTWNTAGTAIGVNAVTGFVGHLMDLRLAGVSLLNVTSAGTINLIGNVIASGSGSVIRVGATGKHDFSGRSAIQSPADGVIRITNSVLNAFTGLDFAVTSADGARIGFNAVNGFTLQSAAGTATWNDPSTAGSGTVANRYLFGIAAPTLTATNASVTDTVASTFYIGGAPTASTNTTIGTPNALLVGSGPSTFGGPVILPGYTVATLPSTAATGMRVGATAYVTDALAPAFLVAVVGGGAVVTTVFYNGTNWVAQ